VIVHGKKDLVGVMGAKPIHIMSPEERTKAPKLEDFFIDLGLPAKEVKKLVEIGNPVTRERELIEMGECVNVKSLDNRASVFVLLEALKKLKKSRRKPSFDFYGVFTVQEEVGLRGAHASALEIQPDFGLGLDTTIAFDTPGAQPQERVTSLNGGAAIKIMDSSTICDYRMVEFLKSTAKKEKIKWQPEILKAGGTDTAGLQRMSPGGSIAGAISIPTRNIHQVIEMCHQKDIAACIDLLTASVCEIGDWDWSH
jgi:endoglucanase